MKEGSPFYLVHYILLLLYSTENLFYLNWFLCYIGYLRITDFGIARDWREGRISLKLYTLLLKHKLKRRDVYSHGKYSVVRIGEMFGPSTDEIFLL